MFLVAAVAAGGARYLAVRGFLDHRANRQLFSARRAVTFALGNDRALDRRGLTSLSLLSGVGAADTFVEVRDSSNRVLASSPAGFRGQPAPPPRLPAVLHPPLPSGTGSVGRQPFSRFETGAVRGSGRYRVLVSPLASDGDILVVAVPLVGVSRTLSHLVVVELAITSIVLAVLGVGAFLMLRAGLRPLERIAGTADEIAHGDLALRVAPANQRTEAGRLGLALNRMLERLEGAFRQLEQAVQRRDRSEAQLRRFVASASHDLRTPLTSIRGYAALFRRGAAEKPADLAKSMARIESEATRMSALIDDLLLLARLDEQRPQASEPLDLTQIALDAVQDARVRDSTRPITMHEQGPVIVIGEARRLAQVVTNLLANAQLHTPPQTQIEIEVGTRGEEAVLAVSDTGPGVDPEQVSHLFEPFYRIAADGAQDGAPRAQGTGLGLAIVAAIMHAHNGSATAGSLPGGGARFEVTLPLAPKPSVPPTSAAWAPAPKLVADARAQARVPDPRR
jgi:two-component system OmpR family sensor kinase